LFPTIIVSIDDDVLTELQAVIKRLPQSFTKVYDRRTARVRTTMQNALQQEPGAPSYPIDWTSEAQKRYFFAVLFPKQGYQAYVRTHALSQGWKVTYSGLANGAQIAITNNAPERPYVEGEWQQGFHADTGWLYEGEVFREYEELLTDIAIDVWASWSEEI